MLGPGGFPIKMLCLIVRFLLRLQDMFGVARRQDEYEWRLPISLLLCQGANYTKNSSDDVPHRGLTKVNESEKEV